MQSEKTKGISYCCEDHTDIAFDDFINCNETFPYLEKVTDNEKCSYCEKKALYVLKRFKNNGPSELL